MACPDSDRTVGVSVCLPLLGGQGQVSLAAAVGWPRAACGAAGSGWAVVHPGGVWPGIHVVSVCAQRSAVETAGSEGFMCTQEMNFSEQINKNSSVLLKERRV